MTTPHPFKGKRRSDPRHDRSLDAEVSNHTVTSRWSDEAQAWTQVCCERPSFLHVPDICARCDWEWDSDIHTDND